MEVKVDGTTVATIPLNINEIQIDNAGSDFNLSDDSLTFLETNGDSATISFAKYNVTATANPNGSTTISQNGVALATIPATHPAATVTNNAAPYSWNATTQTLNIPQVPSIVNGQLVQGDGTVAEQIPDFWRVGTGATGALPDGTTDVTDVIAHQSDIFVGADALMRVGHGGGNLARNTAVGNASLNANTTGLYNTAVGNASLNANTTGSSNTANGESALRSNTTGSSNTANGDSALYSNTTGIYNTASGVNALYSNTTGTANTASGQNALRSNTTGGSNTASGVNALYSNTTAGSNTASGVNALYSNTTGTANTASGVSALYSNTTGDANTASGLTALYSNTTGDANTASGQGALLSNTTGTANTASGQSALYYNQESQNTAIGNKSFDSFNLLLVSATMTASSATQVTLSAPMIPSPSVGSFITVSNIAGYSNSISEFIAPKSYKVINDTTLEVTDAASQVLGTTGTVTNFEIRQSLGYTNSTAAGFDAEPTASNQVKLGNTAVTEINLGNNLIIDVAAILGAATGTPIVKRLVGGIHKITI
jgi:hypothetical protein